MAVWILTLDKSLCRGLRSCGECEQHLPQRDGSPGLHEYLDIHNGMLINDANKNELQRAKNAVAGCYSEALRIESL